MTLGSHQRSIGKSQSHFTPRHILDALGPFDLDPCAGSPRPWDCAKTNYTHNGSSLPWTGRIWLNPPFDRRGVADWIARLASHNNGIALLHARTEAAWFEPIWDHASAILFLADRLTFCHADGSPQPANSGAPAVLAAFGESNLRALVDSRLPGFLVTDWRRNEERAR